MLYSILLCKWFTHILLMSRHQFGNEKRKIQFTEVSDTVWMSVHLPTDNNHGDQIEKCEVDNVSQSFVQVIWMYFLGTQLTVPDCQQHRSVKKTLSRRKLYAYIFSPSLHAFHLHPADQQEAFSFKGEGNCGDGNSEVFIVTACSCGF